MVSNLDANVKKESLNVKSKEIEHLNKKIKDLIEMLKDSEDESLESILVLVNKIVSILDTIHIKDCKPIVEAIYSDDKVSTNLFFIIHILLQNIDKLNNQSYLMIVSFLNILGEEFIMTFIDTYPESLKNLCNISLDNIYNFSKVFNSVIFLSRSEKKEDLTKPVKDILLYINDLILGFKKKLIQSGSFDAEKVKLMSIDFMSSLALDLYKKAKANPSETSKDNLKSCIDIYRYYKFLDESFYFLRVDKPGNFAHYASLHTDHFILLMKNVSKKNRIETLISIFAFLEKNKLIRILVNTDLGKIFGYYENCNPTSIISGYINKFLRSPNLKNSDLIKSIAVNNTYINYLPKQKLTDLRKIFNLEEKYNNLKKKNPSKMAAVENRINELIFESCKEKLSSSYSKKVIDSNIAASVVGVSQKNYVELIKDYIKKNNN